MNTAQELRVYASLQKILYVEDDDILRRETINILKKFFMVVKSACNGQEALELYTKENFDIVLTDIRMPKMDGIELCKEIKILNRKQTIVVMSAHDETEYFIELIKVGIDDFILKPSETDKFLYSLLQACESVECKKELEKLQYKAVMDTIVKKEHIEPKKCTSKLSSIAKSKVNKSDSIKKLVENINNKDSNNDFVVNFGFAIEEINSLNDELEDAIGKIFLENSSVDLNDIANLISIFNEYCYIFAKFESFEIISKTISKMSKLLAKVDLSNKAHKESLYILNFVYEDFIKFINKIFIEQAKVDIAYFNDTLDSSISEFEIKLGFKTGGEHIEIF